MPYLSGLFTLVLVACVFVVLVVLVCGGRVSLPFYLGGGRLAGPRMAGATGAPLRLGDNTQQPQHAIYDSSHRTTNITLTTSAGLGQDELRMLRDIVHQLSPAIAGPGSREIIEQLSPATDCLPGSREIIEQLSPAIDGPGSREIIEQLSPAIGGPGSREIIEQLSPATDCLPGRKESLGLEQGNKSKISVGSPGNKDVLDMNSDADCERSADVLVNAVTAATFRDDSSDVAERERENVVGPGRDESTDVENPTVTFVEVRRVLATVVQVLFDQRSEIHFCGSDWALCPLDGSQVPHSVSDSSTRVFERVRSADGAARQEEVRELQQEVARLSGCAWREVEVEGGRRRREISFRDRLMQAGMSRKVIGVLLNEDLRSSDVEEACVDGQLSRKVFDEIRVGFFLDQVGQSLKRAVGDREGTARSPLTLDVEVRNGLRYFLQRCKDGLGKKCKEIWEKSSRRDLGNRPTRRPDVCECMKESDAEEFFQSVDRTTKLLDIMPSESVYQHRSGLCLSDVATGISNLVRAYDLEIREELRLSTEDNIWATVRSFSLEQELRLCGRCGCLQALHSHAKRVIASRLDPQDGRRQYSTQTEVERGRVLSSAERRRWEMMDSRLTDVGGMWDEIWPAVVFNDAHKTLSTLILLYNRELQSRLSYEPDNDFILKTNIRSMLTLLQIQEILGECVKAPLLESVCGPVSGDKEETPGCFLGSGDSNVLPMTSLCHLVTEATTATDVYAASNMSGFLEKVHDVLSVPDGGDAPRRDSLARKVDGNFDDDDFSSSDVRSDFITSIERILLETSAEVESNGDASGARPDTACDAGGDSVGVRTVRRMSGDGSDDSEGFIKL